MEFNYHSDVPYHIVIIIIIIIIIILILISSHT